MADLNITDTIQSHEAAGGILSLTAYKPGGKFGALQIDLATDKVLSFQEKPDGDRNWVNAGYFVCEPEVFDYIKDGDSTIFERQPLESISKDGKMHAFRHTGFWKPMDTLRDNTELNDMWDNGKAPGKYGRNMSIDIFNNFYKGKRVLVTGHTGFKGSWLSIWLHELGAEVIGVGLEPFTERDNYVLSDIGKNIKADIRADIRDGGRMKAIFKEYEPELVFHLAAQPLVRLSYDIPVETYETNVMGTINVLEAIRVTDSVKVG